MMGTGHFPEINMNSDLVSCDFENNLQLSEIHQDHLALALNSPLTHFVSTINH